MASSMALLPVASNVPPTSIVPPLMIASMRSSVDCGFDRDTWHHHCHRQRHQLQDGCRRSPAACPVLVTGSLDDIELTAIGFPTRAVVGDADRRIGIDREQPLVDSRRGRCRLC